MSALYFILIISIILLFAGSMIFDSYQKKVTEVLFNDTYTIPIDVVTTETPSVSEDVPEIISSYIVEDTAK